jgi:hypothetical protein
MSTGIKGLRVGTGPRGTYIHGGRHGLYYRQSLGTSSQGSSRSGQSTQDNNGALIFILAAAAIFLLLVFPKALAWIGGGILIIAALWGAEKIFMSLRSQKAKNYIALLNTLTETPTQEALASIKQARERDRLPQNEIGPATATAYQELIKNYLAQPGADALLGQGFLSVAEQLGLNSEEAQKGEIDAFKELTWSMLADQELTHDEEAALKQAQEKLAIDDSAIHDELNAIAEFQRARDIDTSELPVISTEAKLQKDEICHYEAKGSLQKKQTRKARGEVQTEEFVPVHEGNVLITSKRILIIGEGTNSIKHEKILEVEADYDEKRITIVKDGRQTPLFLSVPHPIFAGKIIEYLSAKESL